MLSEMASVLSDQLQVLLAVDTTPREGSVVSRTSGVAAVQLVVPRHQAEKALCPGAALL